MAATGFLMRVVADAHRRVPAARERAAVDTGDAPMETPEAVGRTRSARQAIAEGPSAAVATSAHREAVVMAPRAAGERVAGGSVDRVHAERGEAAPKPEPTTAAAEPVVRRGAARPEVRGALPRTGVEPAPIEAETGLAQGHAHPVDERPPSVPTPPSRALEPVVPGAPPAPVTSAPHAPVRRSGSEVRADAVAAARGAVEPRPNEPMRDARPSAPRTAAPSAAAPWRTADIAVPPALSSARALQAMPVAAAKPETDAEAAAPNPPPAQPAARVATATPTARPSPLRPAPRTELPRATPAAPQVHIGRIEIVIESAPPTPAQRPARDAGAAPADAASRLYLRSL